MVRKSASSDEMICIFFSRVCVCARSYSLISGYFVCVRVILSFRNWILRIRVFNVLFEGHTTLAGYMLPSTTHTYERRQRHGSYQLGWYHCVNRALLQKSYIYIHSAENFICWLVIFCVVVVLLPFCCVNAFAIGYKMVYIEPFLSFHKIGSHKSMCVERRVEAKWKEQHQQQQQKYIISIFLRYSFVILRNSSRITSSSFFIQ